MYVEITPTFGYPATKMYVKSVTDATIQQLNLVMQQSRHDYPTINIALKSYPLRLSATQSTDVV